jgi:hypothetical protein
VSEARRGCGHRKIGGLYMVADGMAVACGRFPIPLTICPCCSGGIKQTRSWTWVNPSLLLKGVPCGTSRADFPLAGYGSTCDACPMDRLAKQERAGLLWIGAGFYPTPAAFQEEAAKMGVCRRVSAVPKDFVAGETWVLMAHPKAILDRIDPGCQCDTYVPSLTDEAICTTCGKAAKATQTYTKGIVFAFRPSRIEKCVTEAELANVEEMAKLEKRGITPAVLPDIPIHRGSVYDSDKAQVDIEETRP